MRVTYRQNIRLRCGPRTRQCGGRCVPNDLNCGSNKKKPLRETVEALEDHIKDRHYENAYIIDSRTGEVLSYSAGDRFSVDIEKPESIYGNVLTHNHPPITGDRNSELYKGQSLSHQDVMMASAYNAKEIRAVTNTYRHSMKPKTSWPPVDSLEYSYNRHYSETVTDLRRAVVSGTYNHDQANAMLWHEVNKRVAKEHNMVYSRTTLKGIRVDRAAVRCSPRSKKCGNSCVPKNYKCKDGSTKSQKISLKQEIDNTSFTRREDIVETHYVRPNEVVPRRTIDWSPVGAASTAAIGLAGIGALAWLGVEAKKSTTDPKKFDFPKSEEDLKKIDEMYDEFEPGDLVHQAFFGVGGLYYEHYAVYAGKGEDGKHEVYQVGTTDKDGLGAIRRSKATIPMGGSFLKKVPREEMYRNGDPGFSREEILARAEQLKGKMMNYRVADQNCESFARAIVEGKQYTTQGEKGTHQSVKNLFSDLSNLFASTNGDKPRNLKDMLVELERDSKKWKKRGLWSEEDLFSENGKKDASKPIEGIVSPEEFTRRVERIAKGSMADEVKVMLYTHYLHLLLASNKTEKNGEDRTDALRCTPRSKPCGDVCIPQRYKCRKGSVGGTEDDRSEKEPLTQSSTLSQNTTLKQGGDYSSPRPHETPLGTGLKVAAWGIAGAGSVGAVAIGSAMVDAAQNISYKGEKPRIPKDGIPDEQTFENYNQLKPGELVMRTFDVPGAGTFQHFAIYAGKENGQHFFYSQDTTGVYMKESGDSEKTRTSTTSEYVKVEDDNSKDSPISRQRALRRAELMMGTALDHQGIYNTCETLARGVANDDWATNQASNAGWAAKAVAPAIAKVAIAGMDLQKEEQPFRMNAEEMSRFLEQREGGVSFQQAKNDILEFRKSGTKKDSDIDSKEFDAFFEQTGLMNIEEFHQYAVKHLGKVPGTVGKMAFEKLLTRYLNAILTSAAIVRQGKDIEFISEKKQSKADALDPASAALAKKQLATVVFRVISRAYKEKIDRFLTLDISSTDIITGTVLSKGSIVLFTINLAKKTVETRIIKEGRKDSIRNDRLYRRLKRSKCNTGLSCGSTCISRSAACRLGLNQVASAGETRQMQQLTIALNEDENPSVEEESIRDLRKRASDLGIHKYSRMSKSEMISTINAMESGTAERERLSRSLEKKYEAERFTRSNALSDYAQDWNKANKIMAIAGSGGAFTLAAAALYFYGRAQNEIKKDIDNYRSAFPSMAQQAMAEEKKLRHDQVIAPEHEGVIFAVGGYKGEGSSGHAIRGRIVANAGEEDASEFDKWLVGKHEIRAFNLSKDYPPFEGTKIGSDGKYTVDYLGYLTKNGIEGRLGDKGLLGKAFAGLTDQEKEVPRNQDAITLAAQIYAVAKSKRPGYKELDQMSEEDMSSEFNSVFGTDPPVGVKPTLVRSALRQMREVRGENSFYANKEKSISIIAHGEGGGTAREALEILHLMDGGSEVASRVKLITMSSPRMGLTQKRAAAEWNLTSKDDPLNEFQTQATSVNTVKNREVTSYLKDSNVRTMIAENLGFMRYSEKQEAIMSLQSSLLRDLAKQAEKARKKAKKPKAE